MPGLEHSPNLANGLSDHAPFLKFESGGGGGGLTEAEVLEILHGVKSPKTILGAAIANETVTTGLIKLLAITSALLAEEAVTTAKIAARAVTAAQIAVETIKTENIAPEAITTGLVKLLAITEALLGEESVSLKKLTKALQERLAAPTWESVEELNAGLENPPAIEWYPCQVSVQPITGRVRFRGALTVKAEVAANQVLFKLPVACRPAERKRSIIVGGTGTFDVNVIINPNGNVENRAAIKLTSSPIQFDGAAFYV